MNSPDTPHGLVFENMWRKDTSTIREQVLEVWKSHGGPLGKEAEQRLGQLVFVVKNSADEVVGISSAFKSYVKQLRNHFYFFRLMIVRGYRVPGLTSKLLVITRDYLESVHQQEQVNPPVGLITLVENESLKKSRTEAIWPASKMVYIGNTGKGDHIRVYYFKGARILP
jgi:hypothetical protein